MISVVTTPNLLTVAEVANRLRVSEKTVYRMIADGRITAIVLPAGKRRFYRIEETEVARLTSGGDE
jgi:excisionase family DNA binding protein